MGYDIMAVWSALVSLGVSKLPHPAFPHTIHVSFYAGVLRVTRMNGPREIIDSSFDPSHPPLSTLSYEKPRLKSALKWRPSSWRVLPYSSTAALKLPCLRAA
jgi:hypothetical protein